MTFNRTLFASNSVHWSTPAEVYNQLDAEFHFDLDPCPLGEELVDGSNPAIMPWAGRGVYCNPPYGPGIRPFLERAAEAVIAVYLLPARTDTRWFHELVLGRADEIRFLKGRLKFGSASNPAPFPSMIVVYHSTA